jgi:4-oxalocrotonate tautomerase family enzyme
MPIVSVQLFAGRTTVMKEFLGRAIADAICEIGGAPRDAVQVIFNDVAKDSWAIGPSLVSSRRPAPPAEHVPALVSAERAKLKDGKRDEYVAWRRDSLLPFLASQEGFLSSTLLTETDGADAYVIVDKWTSPEAQARYASDPRAAELRDEAQQFLDGKVAGDFAGRVVDVFHGRA